MNLRFEVIWQEVPQFAVGLWNTVWLCAVGTALSLILGVVFLLPLMSQEKAIRLPAQALVDIARSIPFLMLAYLVYYGLPSWGVTLDSWTTAVSTIAIYNTAYIAEILRGAWANLPPGQTEAARAYGFTGFELLRRITLPQIVLASAPVIGNQLIQVIKDSAFLSVITIPELTFTARAVQATYFVPFESFIVAAVLYWVLCLVIEYGIKQVEFMRKVYVKY